MKKSTKILIAIIFLIGISLLLYPQISNFIVQYKQKKIINSYIETLNIINDEKYKTLYDEALVFNEKLFKIKDKYPEIDEDEYNNILKIDNNGILGFIEVPKINTKLSIYHGVEENVLQVGVGHLMNTSIPIGGTNTHAVLFGHRGLPSAKLFSDLDKMEVDDYFIINVLNEKLYYKIFEIVVVEPDELYSMIKIEPGKDLVSLVTCTPYGINSHRLVLKAERMENEEEYTSDENNTTNTITENENTDLSSNEIKENTSPNIITTVKNVFNNLSIKVTIGIGIVFLLIIILIIIFFIKRRKKHETNKHKKSKH